MKLSPQFVKKPWGCTQLPPYFRTQSEGCRIGEVLFSSPKSKPLPLLIKYIFTSEKLSVQVHPNDEQARERGLDAGKTECWYILDAEPDARLGLGLIEPLGEDALREAVNDGSIEALMDWKPVRPGDVFFVPAGTVHAIGAGISLIEVQQNSDVTYRLYDYGRPRELHLHDGIAVTRAIPYECTLVSGKTVSAMANGCQVLVEGSHFSLFIVDDTAALVNVASVADVWIMPLNGVVATPSDVASRGECLWLAAGSSVSMGQGARALVAVCGEGHPGN